MRDLGTVDILGADAVGQPGQRRFRLFTRTKTTSAILWMEKEQLIDLSLHIDQMLAQITEGRILRTVAQAGGLLATGGELPDDFPVRADYDFRVGEIRLGFEGRRETFTLVAVPFEIVRDEKGESQIYLHSDEELSLWFSIEQAQQLTRRITMLAESGRPVCPLCHAPLGDGPHVCPNQNGHRRFIQILEDQDEQDEEEE